MTPIYAYVLNIGLVLFLVFANAFFVVSEFSIVKIRRTRLEELVRTTNSRRAKIALKINDRLNTYLSAIQLGITLASLGLGWIGEPAVSKLLESLFGHWFAEDSVLLHSISFGIAFSFITLLHVVLGELVPKSLAIQSTERYVLAVAPALYTFNRIFAPFIWIFDHVSIWILGLMGTKLADETEETHSGEEIKIIIDASQKSGMISETEGEIIQNAIVFSEICAHEIMIPRQDMKCLYQDDSNEEVLKFIRKHHHTRFPLCDKDRDHVIGMIHIRDIIERGAEKNDEKFLTNISREILFVPENKSISDILHEMMLKHIHMAVVVDEYGGTAGLLSMEDILEELVGDILDEHDPQINEPIKQIDDSVYEVDGTVLVEDVFECAGLPYMEHEETTMGGYVFGLLGEVPKQGNHVEDEFCRYEVMTVDNMRILRIRIQIKQLPNNETNTSEESF